MPDTRRVTDDASERGRRSNEWRYGEGSQWGQDEFWRTGSGEAIPVESLEPSHLENIIRRIERGNHPEVIEGTPLMRRLRELRGKS